MDLADIIKVDVLDTPPEERKAMARRLAGSGKSLVAEKVETREMFEETLALGYHFFQGYFFSRPTIVAAKDVKGYKLHYFEILKEIHQPDIDFDRLDDIFKREMSLTYKLLRYINSVFFGWRSRVNSVRRALVLLGEKEVKRWASFIVMASMAQDKPDELLIQAVVRARFCEMLAPRTALADRAPDLFLMGLFSAIDAILDRPLPEILADLPIAEDLRAALLGDNINLRWLLHYGKAYEKGNWDEMARNASLLALDEEDIPAVYLEAVEWGTKTFKSGMDAAEGEPE
jgi:EAL and modified HD-GYP domain-containing signal transduction protein